MFLRLSSLLCGLILFLSVLFSQGNPLEQPNGFWNGSGTIPDGMTDGRDEDVIEYSDFEDENDDDDKLLNLGVLDNENVNSVMHLHRKQGEILVPCFGMWWPVGGGGAAYDYVGDYYGDYRKKRRRSRKQKKAAKMKKKKS